MRSMMLSLVVVALLLPGCASIGSGPGARTEVDYVKVARIENAARLAGVNVYWVNYPTKSSSSVN